MKRRTIQSKRIRALSAIVLILVLVAGSGCKSKARSDQQIATDLQARIQNEPALAGQNIQAGVQNGVATLNGTVNNEASRALAANDAAAIDGVRTVVNNLTVQAAQQGAVAPAQAKPRIADNQRQSEKRAQPVDRSTTAVAPVTQGRNDNPAPKPAPAPLATPVAQKFTLPSGMVIPFRITETLNSKDAQLNGVFHGTVANDLAVNGTTVVPRGTPVMGRILNVQEAAHFKGNSLLNLELTEMRLRGRNISLETDSYMKQGAARGKNTAIKAGGGAALGALIGGLAGGGKGAAIGGLAGGAAGVGVNAATRGQQTIIPTETVLTFHLQSPVTVMVPPQGVTQENEAEAPQLQPR